MLVLWLALARLPRVADMGNADYASNARNLTLAIRSFWSTSTTCTQHLQSCHDAGPVGRRTRPPHNVRRLDQGRTATSLAAFNLYSIFSSVDRQPLVALKMIPRLLLRTHSRREREADPSR